MEMLFFRHPLKLPATPVVSAASQSIKAVVRNMDDYLLAPMGKALFAFNQQFNFDKEFAQGDLEVKANGTESLMHYLVVVEQLLHQGLVA